jgi:hypothetical protein
VLAKLTFFESSGDVVRTRDTYELPCRAEQSRNAYAAHVLPDHSAHRRGSLVAAERDLISRAVTLKQQRVSVDEAGKQLSAELKTQHPDWPNTNAAGFVKSDEGPGCIHSA